MGKFNTPSSVKPPSYKQWDEPPDPRELEEQALNVSIDEVGMINDRYSDGIDSAYGDDLDKKTQVMTFVEKVEDTGNRIREAK